jgi:hypothetical protein
MSSTLNTPEQFLVDFGKILRPETTTILIARLNPRQRDWFRCPTCNRRAGTLFIVGPPFGCRVCMGPLTRASGNPLKRESRNHG